MPVCPMASPKREDIEVEQDEEMLGWQKGHSNNNSEEEEEEGSQEALATSVIN